MADPAFPEHLLDQVLADPEAMAALRGFADRQGIATPVSEMSRDELSRLAGALMAAAATTQGSSIGNGAPDAGASDLPPALTEAVFADPNATEILKDLALAYGWTSDPSELPESVKRMFVQLLIDQGVLCVEDTSQGVAGPTGTGGGTGRTA